MKHLYVTTKNNYAYWLTYNFFKNTLNLKKMYVGKKIANNCTSNATILKVSSFIN